MATVLLPLFLAIALLLGQPGTRAAAQAERPTQFATAIQPLFRAKCLRCHSEKRGPFVYEHEPVRVDGCETCHYPHGSTNSRLLRRPVVFTLCLECHNGADSFDRQNSGIRTVSGTHNLADPRYHNCTTCHVRIHGSNSDATFLG